MECYDKIISLGSWCLTGSQLKRYGIKKESYPLDWVRADHKSMINAITDNFTQFLDEYPNNTLYGGNIFFRHHNLSDINNLNYFKRCINRFLTLDTNGRHIFIHVSYNVQPDLSLCDLIASKFPCSKLIEVYTYTDKESLVCTVDDVNYKQYKLKSPNVLDRGDSNWDGHLDQHLWHVVFSSITNECNNTVNGNKDKRDYENPADWR